MAQETALSERGKDWLAFSAKVLAHIEEYTVPQYGDKGEDLATTCNSEHPSLCSKTWQQCQTRARLA